VIGVALALSVSEGPSFAQEHLSLTSAAFASGEKIPAAYTCSGENKSPALKWSGAPSSTQGYAMIVSDPDAPMGTFVHWVIYDIPASLSGLGEGIAKSELVPGVGTQGLNSAGQIGYKGPCPPPGKPHHYHFRLYALNFVMGSKPGLSASELERLIQGHEVASTELVGIFER
jgi:Raf kinase inhibitor-like YbhB/YbcL family protein